MKSSIRHVVLFLLAVVCSHAETRVRIQGMENKSETEVLGLLGGRLTQVRASPASPSRADDAAFLLRKMLHMDGYHDAEVDWKITGPDEVVLIVREGMRLKLGEVTLTGVPADEEGKLIKLFSGPAEKDMKLGGDPAPFRNEDVATGLSFLQQEFHARGYWAAEATEVKRRTDPATGAVNLDIKVVPGKIHTIATPTVKSADGRGVKLVTGIVRPYAGRPATTGNLNAMRAAVEEGAVSRGYPDAKIRMSRTLEPGKFQPHFEFDLGTRVRLGSIAVEGLERTDPNRILKRMKRLEGDWYDEAAMNRRLRGFLATGAFSTARVDTVPTGTHRVDATLHFTESNAKEVTLGGGAGSYEGVIIRAGYTDRNFMGKLLGLNTGFEYSSRGLLGEASITDPWILGSDFSGTARIFALSYGREGYDSLEGGIDGSIRREIGDHYTVDLLAGYSVVNLTSQGLPDAQLGETSYQNPKLRLTQFVDFRDNPVLPTRGWHMESPVEIGAAVGGLSTAYVKAGIAGGWYHALNRKYQVGVGGKLDVLSPSGDGKDLPIDLRLFNGGSRSVRSFPERELGPRVNGYPTGGEAAWSANTELIRTLGGPAKLVCFIDAGSLTQTIGDLGGGEIELATGLGLRLDLPIGPVRFEYGYNLTRDTDEPTGTFHFAIGAAY